MCFYLVWLYTRLRAKLAVFIASAVMYYYCFSAVLLKGALAATTSVLQPVNNHPAAPAGISVAPATVIVEL